MDKFISVHHNSYMMMNQCADIVDYKLPKKLTCANFLHDAIECKDPGQNAAITIVKGDKGPTGNMNKSKDAAA